MDILPAIDLKQNAVVRLTRGDYQQVKVYSNDPLKIARQWLDQGAQWLHLVDLDAALEGTPKNFAVVKRIGQLLLEQKKQFEIGGGIRDFETLQRYLEEAHAGRVILGTIAAQNPAFVEEACRRYPGKIAVGIDVKNGRVATHGWTQTQTLSPARLAEQFRDAGVSCIIYTDTQRDGTLSGYHLEGIADFLSTTSIPIIIAGGLTTLQDLEQLSNLNASQKIIGAIAGKSLYEGTLDLKEALGYIHKKTVCLQNESSPALM